MTWGVTKKVFKVPVLKIGAQKDHLLKEVAVGDVWGIGWQWSKKLIHRGVHTAYDLTTLNPHQLKKQFNVVMMRTAMELAGIPCGGLDEGQPKQSIMSSKSFGEMQTSYSSVAQSLNSHCARAVEKLRAQHLVAQGMYVFVHTNRFRAQ